MGAGYAAGSYGRECQREVGLCGKIGAGMGDAPPILFGHDAALGGGRGPSGRQALSFGFGPQGGSEAAQDTAILLECMSNLVANEQFQAGGSDEEVLGRIDRGIRRLQDCAAYVAVVTNEVFSDGAGYGEETMRYLRLLGQANRRLAAVADRVVEVVYGLEVEWKPLRPPNGSG